MALLFWQQANINRNTEEHPQPFAIEDIMALMGHTMAPPPPPPEPTLEEVTARIVDLNRLYEGQDVRRNGHR